MELGRQVLLSLLPRAMEVSFPNILRILIKINLICPLSIFTGSFHCPTGSQVYFKDPDSCFRYYECSNGQFHRRDMIAPLVLNIQLIQEYATIPMERPVAYNDIA